jgi:hypothetical protein
MGARVIVMVVWNVMLLCVCGFVWIFPVLDMVVKKFRCWSFFKWKLLIPITGFSQNEILSKSANIMIRWE